MQNFLKSIRGAFVAGCLIACSSGTRRDAPENTLVRVAIVKLVNVSGAPLYEYLSDSLTEATRTSMQRKFHFYDLPPADTEKLFAHLSAHGGTIDSGELRAHALTIDADLVIYGRYTTSAAKKGDNAEIEFSVFRSDKAVEICRGNRKAVISGGIFKEIDLIAAKVVSEITAYREQQLTERGEIERKSTPDEKVELTRESINIYPFIPPVF